MNSHDKDKLQSFAQQLRTLAHKIETYIACADAKWNAGAEQYNQCRWDERTVQVVPA